MRKSSHEEPLLRGFMEAMVAGVCPSDKNASTSSVEKCFNARVGGDEGMVNSRFDFLLRLFLGLL